MIDMFVLLTLFTLQALWGLRLKQEGGELSGSRVEVWPSGSERQLRELLNIMDHRLQNRWEERRLTTGSQSEKTIKGRRDLQS